MELKLAFLVLLFIFASTEKVKSRPEAPSPAVAEEEPLPIPHQNPWHQYCENLECETNETCGMCSGECINSHCRA
ncbi:hypothetical protein ABFS82_07G071000 [Erythranthe guttata]